MICGAPEAPERGDPEAIAEAAPAFETEVAEPIDRVDNLKPSADSGASVPATA